MPASAKLPSLEEIPSLEGKRVLVRASLNAPVKDGLVTNDFRLRQALSTLHFLQEQGARTIVIAHIGREPEETLLPIYTNLSKKIPLTWCPTLTGEEASEAVAKCRPGETVLLENLRQDAREKTNDPTLSVILARYADLFVNDAFAASHRTHASIVGVPDLLPSYFGHNFLAECAGLARAQTPNPPSLFVLGGAKFATKAPLIKKFSALYDQVFVGGALANDVFKARGYEVGTSLVSDFDIKKEGIDTLSNLLLPVDVRVTGPAGVRVTTPDAVEKEEMIVDAGPATTDLLIEVAKSAKSVLFNGPLGKYEAGFGEETRVLVQFLAKSEAYTVLGGGDTISAIEEVGLCSQFDFVSTGGGAMLAYLEHGTLPGIEKVSQQ